MATIIKKSAVKKPVVASTPAPKTVKSPAPKTAPVATSASEATTKSPKTPTAKTPSKHIGRTSGMRVMVYQDHTMAQQPERKLTDEELGADWSREFPDTVCKFAERMDIVRTVRKLFNLKRHGKQTIAPPPGGVKKYIIENNKRVAVDDEPSRRGQHPGMAKTA